MVSYPKHVHDAIDKYRKQLDEDPVLFRQQVENKNMQKVREAAAYLSIADPNNIAITDSATIGLDLIYTALNIQKGQEI